LTYCYLGNSTKCSSSSSRSLSILRAGARPRSRGSLFLCILLSSRLGLLLTDEPSEKSQFASRYRWRRFVSMTGDSFKFANRVPRATVHSIALDRIERCDSDSRSRFETMASIESRVARDLLVVFRVLVASPLKFFLPDFRTLKAFR